MTYQKQVTEFLSDIIEQYEKGKRLADRAIAQVSDDDLFRTLDSEANSVALLMKHMAGNMLSRWTDFLTSDGEKADRNRDTEFIITDENSREQLTAYWNSGWQVTLDALKALTIDDLSKTIYIRQEPHSVIRAINRQFGHYSYHIGQIVMLAKYFAGDKWESLSVPRGQSEEFNRMMLSKLK